VSHEVDNAEEITIKRENMHAKAEGSAMSKRNISDRSYMRQDQQGKLYVLRLSGFWGNWVAVALLMLLVPLVVAFFLLFLSGLVAVTVIGIGYAWWTVRKLRRVRPSDDEETIELTASEYHSLEEPIGKERRKKAER
jgi:hypothetical protein